MAKRFSKKKMDDMAEQMHAAVESLDVAKVQAILASGVPPDVWGITDDDDLPLQAVARSKGGDALAIAKALIEAGAEIDYQGDYNCTALARAVDPEDPEGEDWAMARYLLKAGANPSLYDRGGLTPAEYANSNGLDDAVLAMLEAGMDPNVRGIAGPLIWYMAYSSPAIIKALLARGVDPDSKAYGLGCNGQTPLFRAAESLSEGGLDEDDFLEIAIALIEAGADPAQLAEVPDCLAAYLLACKEKDAFSDLPMGKSDPNPHGPL
jgi:ankyrin repeat protein